VVTKISLRNVQRALRVAAVLLAVGLPLGLYFGGAQPVAVGLIPSPYDKLVHAGVFAVMAAAIGYASGLRGLPMLLVAWLGAVAVGSMDEWHQMHLPGRSAGWDDLAADAIGAAAGALALLARDRIEAWFLERWFKHH
jgi:VanZ family protein